MGFFTRKKNQDSGKDVDADPKMVRATVVEDEPTRGKGVRVSVSIAESLSPSGSRAKSGSSSNKQLDAPRSTRPGVVSSVLSDPTDASGDSPHRNIVERRFGPSGTSRPLPPPANRDRPPPSRQGSATAASASGGDAASALDLRELETAENGPRHGELDSSVRAVSGRPRRERETDGVGLGGSGQLYRARSRISHPGDGKRLAVTGAHERYVTRGHRAPGVDEQALVRFPREALVSGLIAGGAIQGRVGGLEQGVLGGFAMDGDHGEITRGRENRAVEVFKFHGLFPEIGTAVYTAAPSGCKARLGLRGASARLRSAA